MNKVVFLKNVKVQYKSNGSSVVKDSAVIWPFSGVVKLVDDRGVLYCSISDVLVFAPSDDVL